jgi:hypothetical protein
MNPPEKKKNKTENEGDIRKERDPKPIPSVQVAVSVRPYVCLPTTGLESHEFHFT